jgi:DNA repair exonuclease SbcCD ATPase subunit
MLFTDMIIENFQSCELVEFNLNQPGMVLISGKNGTGKSTIFDALAWCLFGVTLKNLKADDVVSLKASKNTMVSVRIEDESKIIDIRRYRKHKEHKNSLQVWVNGADCSGWNIDSTQAKVDNLLGMDRTLFTNSVMFAQGYSQFFATLDDSEQKRLIEGFITSTLYEDAAALAKQKVDELRSEQRDVEHEAQVAQSRWDSAKESLEEMLELSENFEADRKRKATELKKELRTCLTDHKRLGDAIASKTLELEGIDSTRAKFESEKAKSKCSKCSQSLPFAKQTELDRLDSLSRSIRVGLSGDKANLNSIERDKNRMLETLAGLDELVNDYKDRADSYDKKLDKLAGDLGRHSRRLGEIIEEIKLYEFWVTGFGNKGIKSFLFDSIIPQFNELVAHYSDLLTDGIIHISLSPTSQLKSGDTRDKFSVQVINIDGSNSHKASSGGEKRSIDLCILWALQGLARNKLTSSINFEVYDECLDTLDPDKTDAVLKVLRSHAKTRSVFVISHNDVLKTSFDTVYYASKHKGWSQLKEG